MGYDPMTHQPRTDIFSSLPHLIALANLKELLDHQSWEDHAVRLQTEAAQVATLNQYLQCLLQPAADSSIDNFNLLNSLSSIKDENTQLEISFGNTGVHDSMPFPHLPDLQVVPRSFETTVNNDFTVFSQGENSPSSPWLPSSSSPSPPHPPPPPPRTQVNDMNCSFGGEGGSANSFWPDVLLDHDPLFS